jgi:hypothetical protein
MIEITFKLKRICAYNMIMDEGVDDDDTVVLA